MSEGNTNPRQFLFKPKRALTRFRLDAIQGLRRPGKLVHREDQPVAGQEPDRRQQLASAVVREPPQPGHRQTVEAHGNDVDQPEAIPDSAKHVSSTTNLLYITCEVSTQRLKKIKALISRQELCFFHLLTTYPL